MNTIETARKLRRQARRADRLYYRLHETAYKLSLAIRACPAWHVAEISKMQARYADILERQALLGVRYLWTDAA